jgi:hypothetical protein
MNSKSLLELITGAEEIAQDNCTFETLDNVHESDRAGYDAFRKYGAKFRTKDGRIDSIVLLGDQLEKIPEREFLLFPNFLHYFPIPENKSLTQIELSKQLYRAMRGGRAYGLLDNIANPVEREKQRQDYEKIANGSVPVEVVITVRNRDALQSRLDGVKKSRDEHTIRLDDSERDRDYWLKEAQKLLDKLDAL